MTDWTKPIALKRPDGKLIPARLSGLNLKGKGVYLYDKAFAPALRLPEYGPDDLGMGTRYFDEKTGALQGVGVIVNVERDLLPDWIDPANGKERMVPEREVRRREQAARAGAGEPAPIGRVNVTIVDLLGSNPVIAVEAA